MPPPPLHTRSGNGALDRPQTPDQQRFTSPSQTPQGSPSKRQCPPGANNLPDAFNNALKLTSTPLNSPAKVARQQPASSATAPNRNTVLVAGDCNNTNSNSNFDDSVIHKDAYATTPGSPTRKSNKENTPPGLKGPKEASYPQNQAAASRQELYQPREPPGASNRKNYETQRGLTVEELEKLQKPQVKRLANVTQLYFLDYYFDLLSYVHARQNRLSQFKEQNPLPPATLADAYESALQKYLGRERANLRKRRTRLRHGDFQILTQVGQGGYGQVYLAQKKDTKEVCALKVMSKRLLFKLDEIRHVLTERDILTAAKSEWLVKLLYAFQDEQSIYLAMVSSLVESHGGND